MWILCLHFGRNVEFRHSAKKTFVHEDSSFRAQRALLRNSGPVPGKNAAGDLVGYRAGLDFKGVPSWKHRLGVMVKLFLQGSASLHFDDQAWG